MKSSEDYLKELFAYSQQTCVGMERKRFHRERRKSGNVYNLHLDQVTINALKSCQKALSKPKGITYSESSIMRRALQYYHAKIDAIENSVKPNKLDLLADEGRETRLAGACIPSNSSPRNSDR